MQVYGLVCFLYEQNYPGVAHEPVNASHLLSSAARSKITVQQYASEDDQARFTC